MGHARTTKTWVGGADCPFNCGPSVPCLDTLSPAPWGSPIPRLLQRRTLWVIAGFPCWPPRWPKSPPGMLCPTEQGLGPRHYPTPAPCLGTRGGQDGAPDTCPAAATETMVRGWNQPLLKKKKKCIYSELDGTVGGPHKDPRPVCGHPCRCPSSQWAQGLGRQGQAVLLAPVTGPQVEVPGAGPTYGGEVVTALTEGGRSGERGRPQRPQVSRGLPRPKATASPAAGRVGTQTPGTWEVRVHPSHTGEHHLLATKR